jgi:hypothetical protein
MEPMTYRKWRFVPFLLVGAVAAGGAFSLMQPAPEKAPAAAAPEPEVEEDPDLVAAPGEPTAAATERAAPPAPASDDPLETTRRNAAEGERARILARERKLDELDWDAARPGPPPAREPAVSKREALLTVADKLEQTVQMTALTRERIAHVESRLRNSPDGANNPNDALLRSRLEARIVELDATAQALRARPDQSELAIGNQATPKREPGHDHASEARDERHPVAEERARTGVE